MHFQGLDLFGAESVSGSASGRGLGCVFQDLGADWGTHWGSKLPLLAVFSSSDFGGGFWQATWTNKYLKQVAAGAGPLDSVFGRIQELILHA